MPCWSEWEDPLSDRHSNMVALQRQGIKSHTPFLSFFLMFVLYMYLRVEAQNDARMLLLEESKAAVATLAAQNEQVVTSLRAELQESRGLRKALQEAKEEGKKRDALVMTNRQLESARHFDRAAQVGIEKGPWEGKRPC